MKKTSIQLIILGLVIAAAFLTACGGSDAPAVSEDASEAVTLDFIGEDIAFNIDEVAVTSGQEVTINFKNEGTLEHSWVLISDRTDPLTATDTDGLIGTQSGPIPSGESTTFTFTAPGPGDYLFVCTIEGHAEAGMLGDFVIQ